MGIPLLGIGDGWVSPYLVIGIPIFGQLRAVCITQAKKYIRRSAIIRQSHSALVKEASTSEEDEDETAISKEKGR